MSEGLPDSPDRSAEALPPFPRIDESAQAEPSVALSMHRTTLSRHRTTLSTNRTEMSKRRTGMSFQRTRMSAERTLMSIMRTSLSLISFGFTIFQFFHKLKEADLVESSYEPRQFGAALVWLGIGLLVLGIAYHVHFMLGLRRTRASMTQGSLIHGESGFPLSLTLVAAVILLFIGILAIFYMLG